MGAWGTGISSNDTYGDIYDQFMDRYNEGESASEISENLIRNNQETIGLEEDAPNFWYALAKAQWECKDLDKDVLDKVEHYVNSGRDLEIWKELGASNSDLAARRRSLDNFLAKLRSDRPTPKKRKKKKYYDSIFKKGDCLVYRMDNGNYGGSLVLTDERMTLTGTNYIAITTIDKPEKPTLDDFRNADVYLRCAENVYIHEGAIKKEWYDRPEIDGYSALTAKWIDFGIEVIGNIRIQNEFSPETISASNWIWLRKLLPTKVEYESLHGKPKSVLKLSKWIKKPSLFSFFKRD